VSPDPVVIPTEDLPAAKPVAKKGLPPDFPHPFAFKKVIPPVDIPVTPTVPVNNDSFGSVNTKELLESLLEDMEVEPTVDPSAENPPNRSSHTASEEIEEIFSPSDLDELEETFEPPLSPDLPSSPEHPDAPLDLVVNLTKEEWSEVFLYGLPLNHDQPWKFYTDSDRMPDQGVNLYMDVPPVSRILGG
jgi:hypothetical protein